MLNVKDYGATGDGTTDDTAAIQSALDAAEAAGGGSVYFPVGIYRISIANSIHSKACLVIPANIILCGDGKSSQIIRLASERSTDGILLVNKNYDTATVYNAAGNILVRDLYFSDGSAGTQHALGDILAFGHAENVTVENCYFGNHDQHNVDIAACKHVIVRNCHGDNATAGTYRSSADIQIDAATVGQTVIWGINLDGTSTTDVLIEGNHFKNTQSTIGIEIGHSGVNTFEKIIVKNNFIDAAYVAGDACISCPNNVSFKDLIIDGNILVLNAGDTRGINIFIVGTNSETLDGINIVNNVIRGTGRVGIYVGTDVSYTTSAFLEYKNISISGNIITLLGTGSTNGDRYAISAWGLKSGNITNNQIILKGDSDASYLTYGIRAERPKQMIIEGNKINIEITSFNFTNATSAIYIGGAMAAAVGSINLLIQNNTITMASIKYGINVVSTGNLTYPTDRIRISGNEFVGTLETNASHIFEKYPCSDGTNGRRIVDFGSGTYIKTLACGQFYSGISMGLKKASASGDLISPAKFELQYAPLNSTDFNTDAESLQFAWTSSTTCVGTQIVDINQNAGTFSILTGVSGVQLVINNSTFQPVIRTSGYLRAYVSI